MNRSASPWASCVRVAWTAPARSAISCTRPRLSACAVTVLFGRRDRLSLVTSGPRGVGKGRRHGNRRSKLSQAARADRNAQPLPIRRGLNVVSDPFGGLGPAHRQQIVDAALDQRLRQAGFGGHEQSTLDRGRCKGNARGSATRYWRTACTVTRLRSPERYSSSRGSGCRARGAVCGPACPTVIDRVCPIVTPSTCPGPREGPSAARVPRFRPAPRRTCARTPTSSCWTITRPVAR